MTRKITVNLQPIDKKLEVKHGTPLIDMLHEYGVEFPCGGKGTCGRCKVRLLKGDLQKSSEQQQKLDKLSLEGDWRLACYCRAESNIILEVSQFEDIILADNSTFEFSQQNGFGIAVDLGTTTIVAQLLNLKNAQVLAAEVMVNPQVKYGADLISRIQSCLDGKQEDLQDIVRNQIGLMIRTILQKHPVKVTKVFLVGNTAMHHIFSGLNVQPLSLYPFESPDLAMQYFRAEELEWDLPEETIIRFYPSVGSFVGSDILAGIAATKMADRDKFSILIDLGTNGEIVIGNRDKIICASTAAGPAFEGAKISQGMRATTGAISSVSVDKNEFNCHVIGNVTAKGICGSGLIDAIAVLLRQRKIGMFGEINSGGEKIELTPDVFLTQQDIREFQLAKAAIAAGLQILLNRLGITFDKTDKIYIAGGFGNFLNIENVIQTGLIETREDKIVKLGNTALIGAKILLFEEEHFIQNILSKTTHINLEGDPAFQDIYVGKMMLG